MKVWVCKNYSDIKLFDSKAKANDCMGQIIRDKNTNLISMEISANNEMIKDYKYRLNVMNTLKQNGFVELLDKFVAREDIENVCDKIEAMIKKINKKFYVQRPLPTNKKPKGETAYGWCDEYRIHMHAVDLTYSTVNDFYDDVKRFVDRIDKYTNSSNKLNNELEKINNMSNDELARLIHLSEDEVENKFLYGRLKEHILYQSYDVYECEVQ